MGDGGQDRQGALARVKDAGRALVVVVLLPRAAEVVSDLVVRVGR